MLVIHPNSDAIKILIKNYQIKDSNNGQNKRGNNPLTDAQLVYRLLIKLFPSTVRNVAVVSASQIGTIAMCLTEPLRS